MRTIRVHAFLSAKGGVGKSSLAVATAKLLADAGRETILIDADMTGTSLADGLDLCAPQVALDPRGGYEFKARDSVFLSRAQTWHARYRRAVAMANADDLDPRPPPPFLNDLLIYALDEDRDVSVASLLWRHEREDGVRYLPSSPVIADLEVAARWLNREDGDIWVRQLAWVLSRLVEQTANLSDVVFDLPPGLFAFTTRVLALCNHLATLDRTVSLPDGFPRLERHNILWEFDPVLVTSQDRNDLNVAVEWFARNRADLPTLRLVANRLTDSLEKVRSNARETLGALGLQGTIPIEGVGIVPNSLGVIFSRGHDLPLTDDVRTLDSILRAGRAT